MTYDELVQSVSDILFAGNPDDQWPSNIPRMIESATLRIFRDLQPINGRTLSPVSISAGSPLVIPPLSCWIVRNVYFQPTAGVKRRLDQRSPDFIEQYSLDASASGTPKYWTTFQDSNTLKIAPTPALSGTATVEYESYPPFLSPTTPTNYFSDYYPDLLLYACMVFAAGYQRDYGQASDDPKLAMSWENRYQSELGKALIAERQRKSDGVFDNSPSPPPSSGLPTG